MVSGSITLPVKVSHKTHGKIEFSVEIPQGANLAESAAWAGGEVMANDCLNKLAIIRFRSRLNADAQNPPEGETLETTLEKYQQYASEAKPTAGRVGPSKKDFASFGEAVRSQLRPNMSTEEKATLLDALGKEFGIL